LTSPLTLLEDLAFFLKTPSSITPSADRRSELATFHSLFSSLFRELLLPFNDIEERGLLGDEFPFDFTTKCSDFSRVYPSLFNH
jgi:hypothetical protein